jgi:ABC-2 type transport system permease protein
MSNVLRVARKELGSFFSSLAAFIFIGVFLAVCLFTFFWVSRFFARNIADIRPLFEWMPVLLIFLVSGLTMRMWSEERRAGTLEFLMTAPARPLHLVLGKFLACLGLVAIALALTLPLPILVAAIGPLDWGPVIGGYIATLCLAAAYISIGLFVSARTDNQIVSLIVTALICGFFYIVGSDGLTRLFGNSVGETLRLVGTGSRFASIERGVIDLRDLYYYGSIVGMFLVLNLYALESLRWSREGRAARHAQWRLAAVLVIANLVAGNLWLGQLGWARADLTQGSVYSLSEASRSYLRQLQEPLLLRGYFSAQTHPLLAPLMPRLRDLLLEYEVASGGKVRVEIVDPAKEPQLEGEANSRYNIRPVPFQTTSKYQAAVTNSYFNLLVKYGDDFEALGYQDLIEIKQQGDSDLAVDLLNPEYEITRAIKKVVSSYRGGSDVFSVIPQKITLEAYISAADKLPDPLPKLRADVETLIGDYKAQSQGKFEGQIRNPDEGQLEKQLQDAYGLRPLAVGLLNPKQFWFHLILRSGDKAVQIALPESMDKDGLKTNIEAELKRFTPGALRTVALYTPPVTPPMPYMGIPAAGGGLNFQVLQRSLQENATVQPADLKDGRVPEAADILFVAAPDKLEPQQLFAVDQFLMKGGTVVLATSPFAPSLRGNITVTPQPSGLKEWLAFNGLSQDDTMVLDPQNSPFPVPVERDVAGVPIRQMHLLDYPYFVDIRADGMGKGEAPTAGLSQLTMSWASPIKVDDAKAKGRKVTRLLESSRGSWTSSSADVLPNFKAYPQLGFAPGKDTAHQLLGVAMEGQFASFFAGKPSPLAKDAPAEIAEAKPADPAQLEPYASDPSKPKADAKPSITGVIERSPESARIIMIGSSSFLSDELLEVISAVDRTQYATPMRFAANLIDWSMEDRSLLALRSRGGQFSRTLPPMSEASQMMWEYANYTLALLGLLAIYLFRRFARRSAERRYLDILKPQGA